MKKSVIFIMAFIIIFAGVIVYKISFNGKFDYIIEEISEFKYYIYSNDNLFGVIADDGQVIIEANYTNVIIPNPSKDVFICYTDEKSCVLNSKKEKIFNKYESVEPIKLKSVASTLSYEKSVLMYKQQGKYGLVNFNGKKLTKNIYDSIENLQPTEGKFLVSKNNKFGVIDLKGNKIVDIKYDKCESDGFYCTDSGYKKSGIIILNKEDDGYRYGYISYNGKKILDVKFNDIERISLNDEKEVFLIASNNGRYGLYNKNKIVLQNEYQEIIYDENVNLLMLQKNKKYGVASLDGDILIDINCDEIESRGNYLYVTKAGDNKVYDTNANIIDINFNASVYNTKSDNYKITTILNNNITYYGIIDKNGNKLVEDKYRYLEYLYKNYFIAKDEEGRLGVINSNGKEVIEMKYNSIQKVNEKNVIQTIDNNGISEFYSDVMEKTLIIEKPIISIQDDYIIISNDQDKKYMDNNGKIINDISNLKSESYPNQIGEFTKEQITIEDIYYVIK